MGHDFPKPTISGMAMGERPDRLQWRRVLGVPKERRYVRVAGVAPDTVIQPFTNDLDTLLRGVLERVFYVKSKEGRFVRPPKPDTPTWHRRMAAADEMLERHLPSTAPMSHQQFVDSYAGRKKVVYQRALDDIRAGRSSLEEDAKLNIFVKFEKTDWTTKKDPVPRIISPRDPKFNIRVGRYLKPLEHRLFKSIAKMFGHPTVIKGYNAEKSAELLREKWDMFRRPVAVGLDASRFDQHVSKCALAWEHQIYLKCFKQRKHKDRLAKLLKCQLVNTAAGQTADGVVKYTINGTRMSGDMNTSLGNCLIMCMMIKAHALEQGVNVALANNGDDCVVFMEEDDLDVYMDGLSDWFLGMGFNMVVETPVNEFEKIEFCQTKPVFDGSMWVMCRNIKTAIVKDSVMLAPYDNGKIFRGWLDAVGTGGLALAGGLPVFQELYQAYVRSGCRRKIPEELIPWSFRSLKDGQKRGYRDVHPEARSSFYSAFGITPDEQVCLEKYYRSLTIDGSPNAYAFRPIFIDGAGGVDELNSQIQFDGLIQRPSDCTAVGITSRR